MELLTHLLSPTVGRKVLYTKPYLDGETTCYQIKIISRNIKDEETYNESEVFRCHVCNVTVLRKYLREHTQSKMHQNNKKITKKVLQNIFEHFHVVSDRVTKGAENTFYCAPCINTVALDKAMTHNWSKDHFKAMDRENLFDNFVKMFFEIEPYESMRLVETVFSKVINDEVESAVTAAALEHETASRPILLVNIKAKGEEHNTMKPITAVNRVSESGEILTSDTNEIGRDNIFVINDERNNSNNTIEVMEVEQNEIEEFKQYVKDMFVKYKLNIGYWLEMNDPERLTAVAPNGFVWKISIDAYHSFKQSNNSIYCQLCNSSLTDDTKKLHIITEEHVQNVAIHPDNEFCRRVNDLYSHDLVRNEVVFIGPTKILKTILKPMTNDITFRANDAAEVNDLQITGHYSKPVLYCEICHVRVLKKNFKRHTRSRNHRNNKSVLKNQNVSTQNSLQVSQEDKPENTILVNNADESNISMGVMTFLEYLKDMVSKYNIRYKIPVVKNGDLVVVTPNRREARITVEDFHGYRKTETGVYCQLCQMTISNDIRVHSGTPIHVNYITQRIDDNFCRKISTVINHCLLCNKMVYDCAEHVATDSSHKKIARDNVSNNKETENHLDKKRKVKYCDVCDIYLTPNRLNKHVSGHRHMKHLTRASDKNTDSQTNEQKKLLYCNTCKRKIYSHDFEAHIKGKKHNIMVKLIRKRLDKAQKVIKPPPAYNRPPQNMSLQSSVNETNFSAYLKEMVAKFKINCRLPVVEGNGVVVVTPKGFREWFPVNTFHSYKQAESSVVCQVCRMNVMSKDTRAHSATKHHVTNILQPVDDNFSRKINKAWSHCLVCNLTVLNSFDHVAFSDIHKKYHHADPRGSTEKWLRSPICESRV